MEGTTRTKITANIKRKTIDKEEDKEKKIKPCETPNHSKRKTATLC